MFNFINTIEVLPVSSVDTIHRLLRDGGLAVPVVLKPKSGMPGFVALHAWIPLSEPVCRLLPTELVVDKNRMGELRELLDRFIREVQHVAQLSLRETKLRIQSPTSEDGLDGHGSASRLSP